MFILTAKNLSGFRFQTDILFAMTMTRIGELEIGEEISGRVSEPF